MARALMGEDFEVDDREAMPVRRGAGQGTDAAAGVLVDALEEERDEDGKGDGGADADGDVAHADTSGADAMFARAIASTLGVVDKIDFDSLVFETDDE